MWTIERIFSVAHREVILQWERVGVLEETMRIMNLCFWIIYHYGVPISQRVFRLAFEDRGGNWIRSCWHLNSNNFLNSPGKSVARLFPPNSKAPMIFARKSEASSCSPGTNPCMKIIKIWKFRNSYLNFGTSRVWSALTIDAYWPSSIFLPVGVSSISSIILARRNCTLIPVSVVGVTFCNDLK